MSFLTRIRYMDYAKHFLIFSLVLSLVGLGAFLVLGLNRGIDFTGGLLLDVQFEQTVTMDQLRSEVSEALGTDDIQVQNAEVKGAASPTATEYFLRTPELSAEQKAKLYESLKSFGTYEVISEDQVSGSVSAELTQRAVLAIAIAAVLQVIYIWIRFELKMGVTAVLALLHDTIVTIGLLSLLRVQINSTFVAAILTILGYSMNDTVVVMDRIRENLHNRKKGESLKEMTTRSIQEVVTRSIFTGISVQLMLIAMLIWGRDTIFDFALTLFIGIAAGTYSSIFVAASLWLLWEEWSGSKRKHALQAKPKPAKA